MKVTFCGHGTIHNSDDVKRWLYKVVKDVIILGGDTFYLGGYGTFDYIAKQVVWELKEEYPHIESLLVIPYLDKKYDLEKYDSSIYPSLENVPKRFAISKRNEWMVKESHMVISYVTHSWGGAAITMEYAKKKKKTIINYPQSVEERGVL